MKSLSYSLDAKAKGDVLRASPTGDANGELNPKTCIFAFRIFIKLFQRSSH